MFRFIIKIYNCHKQIINYLICGFLTVIVSIVSYTIFTRLFSINYILSNILSWILAVTFAFFTNRIYVFKSKKKNVLNEFICFYISRFFSLLIEVVIMYILVEIFCINDLICKFFTQIIVIVLNYFLSKFIVFKTC